MSAETSSGARGRDCDAVVLYATAATVAELAGSRIRGSRFRLADAPTAAATTTVDGRPPDTSARTPRSPASPSLPQRARARATYPGKELFEQMASLMNVFTVLALFAAIVLVANTMGTLVAEQRHEIGIMKAIGGTRRQIRRVYLLTALLLGEPRLSPWSRPRGW